ncbi:MAG: hypothetical protein M1838_000665 [Thelocarpon superellum]|nr:MAG: hypothetical protein M1838_000665 [Thelocarpon superellum]
MDSPESPIAPDEELKHLDVEKHDGQQRISFRTPVHPSQARDGAPLSPTDEGEANERQPRIAFRSPSIDTHGRPRRRRRRSNSRDTISSIQSRAQSTAGIPLEYRSLSMQVSESHNVSQGLVEPSIHHKRPDDDRLYFEQLTFHTVTVDQVCQQFNVSFNQGLSAEAAARRLQRDGKNTVAKRRENYLLKVLGYIFGGFCSILWIGVIIFFLCWRPLSDPPSVPNLALAILVIIVILLQASFSAFQDWSTQRVMNSILDMLPSEAHVMRDGNLIKISAVDLVAGDIVHISIGNKVPADMRLIETSGDIRFDRSMLTGESDEVEGAIDATDDNFLETRNIAAMGTNVTNGNGVGIVVLTGGRSIMGRISKMTTGVKDKPTLIQKEISRFIRIIIALTLCLALLILCSWIGWLRVRHFAFMNVVAMLNDVMGCVVAFIPEGVPVGVALTLLMIARRMKQNNVLPKGLATVETLGCVNVICSDKTGTLTENKMVVTTVGFVDQQGSVGEAVAGLTGKEPSKALEELHRASTLCNDATFDPLSIDLPIDARSVNGNATDAAVLRFAETAGPGAAIRTAHPRMFQIPFNSKNKWMLTMHRDPESTGEEENPRFLVYVKGAPDILLPRCAAYWRRQDNTVCPLDEAAKSDFSALQVRLAKNAERVILLCQRLYTPTAVLGSNYFGDEITNEGVQDLTIIGVVGITDPPRAETAQTVASCRRAGARFFMVTGDFGLTAAAIARNVGIFTGSGEPDLYFDLTGKGGEVDNKELAHTRHSLLLEGASINKLTAGDWEVVCRYEEIVFARTTPEQKLRIVNEFKARDYIIAVTGDGVNDAPALRAADVGIAVVSGSDVAIEAADLILLDKFDSIIEAIRLGRLVFQNLQKLICYLLPAGSWSEIWPVIMNVFFGVPLPLSSFLMIIICVFTDLFLCLALIMEREEFDLLDLPPRNHKRDHLINLKIYIQSYLFIGVMETICAHAMFFLYMYRTAGIPFHAFVFAFEAYTDGFYGYTGAELVHFNRVGQCVYFVTLVILQWGNILSVRNKRLSILQADPFFDAKRRNPYLPLGALISLIIAVFVTEVPGIQNLFGTASVPLEFWFLPLPLALGILAMDELRKVGVRAWPRGFLARIAW